MEQRKDVLEKISDFLTVLRDKKSGGVNVVDFLGFYFEKACTAKERGEPLAWTNFGVPSELFWAMDITPIVVDVTTGTIAGLGEASKYIDIAEEHIPDYLCSNNKILLGAALAGDIPLPCILVHPASPCDSNLATYPHIARHFGFPYFCIGMPYFKSERGVQYIAGELGKLVSVLEEITKRKLDLDKLQQTMEYSNLAHEYILKLNKLRQTVPSPYPSLETVTEYGILLSLAGTPELVEYLKQRYEWAKAKVERGEGHLGQGEEKIRLVWIYGAVTFNLGILYWLEKHYGAVSVCQMNNNFVIKPVEDLSSIDSILMGLAEKVTLMPMTRECGGPWENYLDAAIDMCRDYKADAAIFAGHLACKSNWAVAKLVKDRIQDELGIPVLNLQLDLFDKRVVSLEAIKGTFDDFITVVLQR